MRSVRLKASSSESFFKSFSLVEEFLDCIGLIAISDNKISTVSLNGIIYDECWIYFGILIKRCDSNHIGILVKHSVTAIFTSSHYKIGNGNPP